MPSRTPPPPPLGVTSRGDLIPARTADHLPAGTLITKFNKMLAVRITTAVGTMWAAYLFACIALISLPSALSSHSILIMVSWLAQTFLQLVLLAVIIVGQKVQSEASDVRARKTFEDVEHVIDLLRIDTEGGLKDLYEKLHGDIARIKGP